jgi:hypothetical protein
MKALTVLRVPAVDFVRYILKHVSNLIMLNLPVVGNLQSIDELTELPAAFICKWYKQIAGVLLIFHDFPMW